MRIFPVLLCLLMVFSGRAQRSTASVLDSLPESQIDIPIQVNLRPIYALAERKVDTVFTSPNYPDGWVQADCATRYKYHFRRSALGMSMSGTSLNLTFLGYYQIVGSTRACVKGLPVTLWTPGCRCGYDEAERRVLVSFNSSFQLQPNLVLRTRTVREEPKALDKCSVCFWGQDITNDVIKGLKDELDASRKAMEDSFGSVNLRPYLQQAWNMLNQVYALPNMGYFALHPKKLRMENINARNDLLNISIGISATPAVSFDRPEVTPTAVPNLVNAAHPGGFNIFLEAALQYDSLGRVLNGYLGGKRFDFTDGLFKRHITVNNTSVSGDENGHLLIRVDFSGSFDGTVMFTGVPVYDSEKKAIVVADLDYDLQTKNLLLKTAKWLFNKKIIGELKKYTSFDLSQYYDTASKTLNEWLNREWTKGIHGSGSIKALTLTAVHAQPEHLLIRSNCAGQLSVQVSELEMKW